MKAWNVLRRWALGALLLGTAMTASGTSASHVPLLGDLDRARRARDAIVELDVAEGRKILEGADLSDTALALERARLELYEGNYDAAVSLLSRPDLSKRPEAAELGEIARGAARATAGAVVVNDARGVVLRLQDDDDRALAPLIVDVALRARALLAKELGVELPLPLHIELVRDQFTLAAMTGLPEEAAQTTGTVAVAKWGRVTMLSPRATHQGYQWLDTLAHELTHLALTRGTRDKAPLWLQEGVAKREETRWREKEQLDEVPPIDAVAAVGLEKGLGVELDKMGPSIALLPSAEQAQVAYAEVASFVRFWAREAGDDALPQLVLRLKAVDAPNGFERAISEVSAADFATWVKRWRGYLGTVSRELPQDLTPGARPANLKEVSRRARLGELLQARGHAKAAAIEHARAHALLPYDAAVRCWLAESLLAMNDTQNAAQLVERIEDVHGRFGRWYSLNGRFYPDTADPDRPFRMGIALDPLDPSVACDEKPVPELPKDPIRAAICEMARRAPR